MKNQIQLQTVSIALLSILSELMKMEELLPFNLVGGTCLSLQLGHRLSEDIDLFTDSDYRTIDFQKINNTFSRKFNYISSRDWINETIGNTCFVGESKLKAVKVDLFYTDKFMFPIRVINGLRLSSIEEIAAMKLEIIGSGGRKKDFWDLHALLDHFSIEEMFSFYKKRYPYNYSNKTLVSNLVNFDKADLDPDPHCLLGKYWQLIKLDLISVVENYNSNQ